MSAEGSETETRIHPTLLNKKDFTFFRDVYRLEGESTHLDISQFTLQLEGLFNSR